MTRGFVLTAPAMISALFVVGHEGFWPRPDRARIASLGYDFGCRPTLGRASGRGQGA